MTCSGRSRSEARPTGVELIMLVGKASLAWALASLLCVWQARADSPVADAAEKSDRASVREWIERKADANGAQIDGMTALHWAAHHDDIEMARLLFGAKADVNAANRYGVTPLSLACVNGNESMVLLLLESGAKANAKLRGDETVLMTAARTGKLGAVKALLARGALVNAKERRGQTALMWASAEGHADVVSALLESGAELRETLPSGFNALFFAVREGRLDVSAPALEGRGRRQRSHAAQEVSRKGARQGDEPVDPGGRERTFRGCKRLAGGRGRSQRPAIRIHSTSYAHLGAQAGSG